MTLNLSQKPLVSDLPRFTLPFPLVVPIKGEGQPLVLPHKAPSSKQVIHDVPMDGLGSLLIDPRIVLQGRPFAPMPRQILHGHDVRLPLEEVRHKGLPEDVMRDLLFNAELSCYAGDQPMRCTCPNCCAPSRLPHETKRAGLLILAARQDIA